MEPKLPIVSACGLCEQWTGVEPKLSIMNACCCDMGQNDTIRKIELKSCFVLSSDNTNCKNDIQLFLQLFDELRVNRDCH